MSNWICDKCGANYIDVSHQEPSVLREELELRKVKQQLAIAVKALEYYKDKKTWCLCEKSQCAYVDGMTADLALKKIKELDK